MEKTTLKGEIEKYSSLAKTNEEKFYNMTETLKENLQCLICKSLLEDSIMLYCCQHFACKRCAQRWVRDNENCPHCRADINISDLLPIRQLEWILQTLRSLASVDERVIDLD